MVQRRRRTAKRPARRTKRTTTKAKSRAKKGVKKAVKAMQVTPAQRKKLQQRMRDFERHINQMTRKYNQLLTYISRW